MPPEAMLQAIAAEPDDDDLRLIHADWLEDHGEPERAEFIRVQCERARLPDGHPGQRKLLQKERALLQNHGLKWRGWIAFMGFDHLFRRGFLEEVTLSAEIFVEQVQPLADIPTLRLVGLRDIRGNLDLVRKIAGLPALQRLHGLRFEPIDPVLRFMTPEPGFTAGAGLTAEGLEILLWSPNVGHLETLELPGNDLDNRACDLLGAATHLRSLQALVLRANRDIREAGMESLARARHLAGLRRLDLSRTRLGPDGIRALAHAQYLTGLTELDLSEPWARLLTADVVELMEHFPFPNLTALKLNEVNIQRTACEAIARCKNLGKLQVLELNGNRVGDRGAEALARSPQLANLKVLRLRRNDITAEGTEALAGSKYLKNLQLLDLGGNLVGKEERKELRARFGKSFARF
jgi:uncharacterized protein (TIGR02996 family)